jgi:hypothetical protein
MLSWLEYTAQGGRHRHFPRRMTLPVPTFATLTRVGDVKFQLA